MFKKPNYYTVRSYNETIQILDRELKKLDDLGKLRSLSPEETKLYDFIKHTQAKLIVDCLGYINKNVTFRKRFWRNIAKKMK